MRMFVAATLPLFALLIAFVAPAGAQDSNARTRWSLAFEPGRMSMLSLHGVEGHGIYPYMIFKVTNESGRDLPLNLFLSVDTDVPGQHYRGSIDPIVRKYVEARLGRKLKTLSEVRGTLANGASEEVIVTFGKLNPNVDRLTVSVRGLVDRVYRDRTDWFVEDQILTLTYASRGDEFFRQNDPLTLKNKKWTTLPKEAVKRAN